MRGIVLVSVLVLSGGLAEVIARTGICPRSPLQINSPICMSPELLRLAAQKDTSNTHSLQASWKGPEHCVNGTCIFSNQRIGNGIVLLTTERNAAIASNFPLVASPTEKALPFHVAEVPGKGVGVVADRKIRKGETIFIRTPTMMVQTAPHLELEPGMRDVLYDLTVERLPSKGRNLFLGQMGKDVYDKIETNCFHLYIDGANESGGHLGCYPEISRFNHDCRPK